LKQRFFFSCGAAGGPEDFASSTSLTSYSHGSSKRITCLSKFARDCFPDASIARQLRGNTDCRDNTSRVEKNAFGEDRYRALSQWAKLLRCILDSHLPLQPKSVRVPSSPRLNCANLQQMLEEQTLVEAGSKNGRAASSNIEERVFNHPFGKQTRKPRDSPLMNVLRVLVRKKRVVKTCRGDEGLLKRKRRNLSKPKASLMSWECRLIGLLSESRHYEMADRNGPDNWRRSGTA